MAILSRPSYYLVEWFFLRCCLGGLLLPSKSGDCIDPAGGAAVFIVIMTREGDAAAVGVDVDVGYGCILVI